MPLADSLTCFVLWPGILNVLFVEGSFFAQEELRLVVTSDVEPVSSGGRCFEEAVKSVGLSMSEVNVCFKGRHVPELNVETITCIVRAPVVVRPMPCLLSFIGILG